MLINTQYFIRKNIRYRCTDSDTHQHMNHYSLVANIEQLIGLQLLPDAPAKRQTASTMKHFILSCFCSRDNFFGIMLQLAMDFFA